MTRFIVAFVAAAAMSSSAAASDFAPEMPRARFEASPQDPPQSIPIQPNSFREDPAATQDPKDWGLCRIEKFEVILEGWTGNTNSKEPVPCHVKPIEPQPQTCPTAPCVNTSCHGLMHYRVEVELSPGASALWPACYFKQQRMGYRSYNNKGVQTFVQFEPVPTYDFEGGIGPGTARYRQETVPGKPNHYVFHFYDTPGWLSHYWDGRPNALAHKWFPMDWHYMYRAYIGPKRKDFADADYTYMHIDMEARVAPEMGVTHQQAAGSTASWSGLNKKLEALRGKPGPSSGD